MDRYLVLGVKYDGTCVQVANCKTYDSAMISYNHEKGNVGSDYASLMMVNVISHLQLAQPVSKKVDESVAPCDRTPLLTEECISLLSKDPWGTNNTMRPLTYMVYQGLQQEVLKGNLTDRSASSMLEDEVNKRMSVDILRSQMYD